jgi:hypothetical protein
MDGCYDSGCPYSPKGGMRTNGGCKCDMCPMCGAGFHRARPGAKHKDWCTDKEWVAPCMTKAAPGADGGKGTR